MESENQGVKIVERGNCVGKIWKVEIEGSWYPPPPHPTHTFSCDHWHILRGHIFSWQSRYISPSKSLIVKYDQNDLDFSWRLFHITHNNLKLFPKLLSILIDWFIWNWCMQIYTDDIYKSCANSFVSPPEEWWPVQVGGPQTKNVRQIVI